MVLSFGAIANAQVARPDADIVSQPDETGVKRQPRQDIFGRGLVNLLFGNAKPQQVQEWLNQNVSRLEAQKQLAMSQGASKSNSTLLGYVTEIEVDPKTTPEMSDFLLARAELYNHFALLHNEQRVSGSETVAVATFRQQNASAIAAQLQRIQIIGMQSDQQPVPVLPPLSLPSEVPVPLRTLLKLQDLLLRDQVAAWNQSESMTDSENAADFEKWQQSYSFHLQQIQRLIPALSNSD